VLRSATRPGLTRRDYCLDGAAVHFIVLPKVKRGNGTPAKDAPANKTAKDAPADKTAAKK
jgi:hypothetical protein